MSVSAISGSLSYQTLTLNASRNGGEKPEDKFAELDVNGDGGISFDESGLSEEEFAALDVDGDELLTEMDREAHLIEMMQKSQQMEPPDLSTIMAEMDGDGDGYVTETELADHLAKMEQNGMKSPLSASELMAEMDTDGDGMVNEAELEAHLTQMQQNAQMMPPPPPPSEEEDEDEVSSSDLLSALDSDEDGELSVAETGLGEEEFDALDTNKDGFVSLSELEAASSGGGAMEASDSTTSSSLTNLAMSAYLSMTSAYLSTESYQSVSLTA